MKGRYYVYLYTDPRNGNPLYVGKGQGKRYKEHLIKSHNRLLNNKIKAIRSSGLEPTVEVIFRTDDEMLAYDTEEFLISSYGIIVEGGLLCNFSKGGRGNKSKDYPDQFFEDLGNYTDEHLSTVYNLSRSMVSHIRRGLDIPVSDNRTYSEPPYMAGHNRIELPQNIIGQLGTKPDYILANECGCTKGVVARVRKSKGIKSYAEQTGNDGKANNSNKPRLDRTVREFFNVKTGETFKGLRSDFCNYINENSSRLSPLIRGKAKTFKSWRLV